MSNNNNKDTPLFPLFFLYFFLFFVVISTTMDQPRQPRISRPTAKLIDANNLERAPLAYQRNAIAAENARVEASSSHAVSIVPNSLPQSAPPIAPSSPVSTCQPSPSDNSKTYQLSSTANKHPIILSDDEEASNSGRKQKRRKKSSSERPSSKH
jgi:hypothetical protein